MVLAQAAPFLGQQQAEEPVLGEGLEGDARETVTASESVTAAAGDQSSATSEIATSAAALLESSERLAALVADFKV